MAQYKTGTATVTNNSATVAGTGTLWTANVSPGDGFTVAGTGVPYTVASVTNDTSLELSAPYTGVTASGQSYAIYRDFTTNNSYPELSQGDIETATIWTRALRLIDGDVGAIEADYYNTGNILGTVSQSAGVPTGAIIESGSNSNGSYTKFADGTMICRKGEFVTLANFSATWNFPAAFIDTNITYGGMAKTGSNHFVTHRQHGSISTVRSYVLVFNNTGTAIAESCSLTAIGRWW